MRFSNLLVLLVLLAPSLGDGQLQVMGSELDDSRPASLGNTLDPTPKSYRESLAHGPYLEPNGGQWAHGPYLEPNGLAQGWTSLPVPPDEPFRVC
jgi:hypothetical protein